MSNSTRWDVVLTDPTCSLLTDSMGGGLDHWDQSLSHHYIVLASRVLRIVLALRTNTKSTSSSPRAARISNGQTKSNPSGRGCGSQPMTRSIDPLLLHRRGGDQRGASGQRDLNDMRGGWAPSEPRGREVVIVRRTVKGQTDTASCHLEKRESTPTEVTMQS